MFIATLIRSAFGFGEALVAVPLLAFRMPLPVAAPLAVLEVECRSRGSHRCRFLVGSAEVMGHLYERMTEGASYQEAAAALA